MVRKSEHSRSSPDNLSHEKLDQLPNPMVLLDDAWPGIDMWGKEKGIRVSDPSDVEERVFRLGINQTLHSYLKGIYPTVIKIDGAKMSHSLAQFADKIADEKRLMSVFLDSLLGVEHSKFGIQRLDLCRITDTSGTDLGLGSRPNTPSVKAQLDNISEVFRAGHYSGVVLIDDIVGPHATTVLKIRDFLKNYDIDIGAVVAAATFVGGREALSENGISLDTLYSDDVTNNGDILNTRDLFPYHPYGGLKGRTTLSDNPGRGTIDVSFPYIAPFFPRTLSNRKLFVVPEAERRSFGTTFLTGSLLVFQHINRLNGRAILLGDLNAPAFNNLTVFKSEEVEHRIAMNLLHLSTEGHLG